MLTINTNLSSLITQRSMKQSTNKLNQAIERMTTGFKINHAKDNAANFGIVTNMTTQIGSLDVAEDNTSMALDLLTTASDNLSLIQDRVQRLRDLQEQASNGTYGEQSLLAINAECNSLVDEINRLYLTTEYNGINLFLETTTNADGEAEILQEVYADQSTTFEDLGITSSSFSIYDKNDALIATYDIDETNTIDDFFATLETHNFTPTMTSGKITVKSNDGAYIAGDLADELGITTEQQTYVASTSQTSSAPVTYESVSSSTTEEVVSVTTTTSETQTNTIDVIRTTEQTSTETIMVTTTSTQTETETVLVTTTTQSAVTETFFNEQTVGVSIISYNDVVIESVTTTLIMATLADVANHSSDDMSLNLSFEDSSHTHSLSVDHITVKPGETYQTIFDCVKQEYSSAYFENGTIKINIDDLEYHLCAYSISYGGGTPAYIPGLSDEELSGFVVDALTNTTTTIATSSSPLFILGITTTQYITVQNNGTQTVITCNISDTIGSITAKLTSAGLTSSFSSGKISIAASDTAYISGISSTLASKLGLSGSYSSVKTTTTETTSTILVTTTSEETRTTTIYVTTTSEETRTNTVLVTTTAQEVQTETLYTTTTTSETRTTTTFSTTTETATADTSFAEMGLKSGVNIGVVVDGQKTSINLSKDSSINDLISTLQANGLNASFVDNKLTIEGDGNSYVSSSSLTNLFNLGAINKTTAERNVNTKSNAQVYTKNLLAELGEIYAPGSFELHVGTVADSNSQIGIKTAFSLVGYNDFRGIGLDGENYLAQLDSTLEVLNSRQVELGAAQNRLLSALDEITIRRENLISSRSTLRDADIAEVSSEYIKQQILQQASATLMATANQSPAIALQLI